MSDTSKLIERLAYWLKVPRWTAQEAASLLLGLDPDTRPPRELREKHRDIVRLIERSRGARYFNKRPLGQIRPRDLFAWAASNDVEIADTIARLIRPQAWPRNWRVTAKQLSEQLEEARRQLKLDKPIDADSDVSTRTLLTVIAIMSRQKYHHKPHSPRGSAAPGIKKDAVAQFIEIHEDSILRALRNADALILSSKSD